MSHFEAVGLGNAIMDALVRVPDDSVIARLGFPRGQMTPVDDVQWQEVHDELKHLGVEMAAGGSCANTIAAMGLMGANVCYSGRIGEDALGRAYTESLKSACGHHALQRTPEHATGKCLSIISADAERTMLTDLGASVTMPGLGSFDQQIRSAGILHVTGYLLLGEPMASRCMEAIAVANQEEIKISIDLADPFVVHACLEEMMHILEEFASVVFLNADEAHALLGVGPEEAAKRLSEDVEHVVVKIGKKGSIVCHGGQTHRIGIYPTTALDTTGAGDAYAAGYLYGLSQGWEPRRCGDLGSRVASLTVGQVGAVCRDTVALMAAVAAARA
jgi:sugar/nucleoside kinase (ribokinase family)